MIATYSIARCLAVGLLLGCAVSSQAAPRQTPGPSRPFVPADSKLSDIEVQLAFETHGGCYGRCIKYRVAVRGDGVVQYEDLGNEPRDQPQRRTIAIDEVVSLVNDFVRARFSDAPARYDEEPVAFRRGDLLNFALRGGADGPDWDLTLRVGSHVKTIHLYKGFPIELGRLRDRVESIGGPKAWTMK